MRFEFTGRHVNVTPALRTHVKDHFSKLDDLFAGATVSAHVIMEVQKNRQTAEVLVRWRDHNLTASHTGADMYQALARAIVKIEKQAIKLKKKIVGRNHGAQRLTQVAPHPDHVIEAGPLAPRIISARRYAIKPMTADEAALRLTTESDQFLVFRDADTERIGVIYKRKDGNFGLIEP